MARRHTVGGAAVLLLAGCSSPGVTIDERANVSWWTREPIAERVEEDGLSVKLGLQTRNLEGREVSVLAYDEKGCVGETRVQPSSELEEVLVFLPWSRVAAAIPDLKLKIYVTSPDDPATHLAQASYTFALKELPDFAFRSLGVVEDETSVRAKLRLDVKRIGWERGQVIVLIRDDSGKELSRISGPRLEAGAANRGKDVHWADLEVTISYATLAHLDPALRLRATVALEVEGGAVVAGTVHFPLWAGGSFERIEKSLAAENARLDEEIRRAEEQLRALGGSP